MEWAWCGPMGWLGIRNRKGRGGFRPDMLSVKFPRYRWWEAAQ